VPATHEFLPLNKGPVRELANRPVRGVDPDPVMVREGAPSTAFGPGQEKGVDGAPSRTMTGTGSVSGRRRSKAATTRAGRVNASSRLRDSRIGEV
jgi:hypothetical protein